MGSTLDEPDNTQHVVGSAGLPLTKKSAAETLTNLAAAGSAAEHASGNTLEAPKGSSSTPSKPGQVTASDGAAAQGHTTSSHAAGTKMASSGSTAGDRRLEVQRAGAIHPLVVMLALKDESCVQAAATALNVLAGCEENLAVLRSSGARQALQAVLAKAKRVPPAVSMQTKLDCEAAFERMLA